MNSGKILLSVLAGVAAGALVGVLFAPDKGLNTRKKISRKADDYADALGEKFKEYVGAVTEKMEMVKDEASDFVAHAKARTAEAKKNFKTATE